LARASLRRARIAIRKKLFYGPHEAAVTYYESINPDRYSAVLDLCRERELGWEKGE
jgi:hypothetical protein